MVKSSKPESKVPQDRRAAKANERRDTGDRRAKGAPVADGRRQMERRAKVNRRRQIDPTTCERDYSGEEVEFMHALDQYKRTSGRMFPTCSEILEVIRGLGYRKLADVELNRGASDHDAAISAQPMPAIILGDHLPA